jgi:hypothetical protein
MYPKGKPVSSETRLKMSLSQKISMAKYSNQIEFKCDYCASLSSEKASHYNRKKRHFCSMHCYSAFRKEFLPKEEQHAYQNGGMSIEEKQKRIKARSDLNHAVRDGKLIRLSCQKCGADCAHAHHHDYDKPLDVIWLCLACHWQEHSNENLELLEAK